MRLALEEDGLRLGEERAGAEAVLGFHERYDPWRDAVWLDVAGPDWSVRVGEGYAALRRALRAAYPDRPFTADWSRCGTFPAMVLGRAPAPWFAAACVVAVAVTMAVGVGLGPAAGILAALGWVWPLLRLRSSVRVTPVGMRVGPIWAPLLPWHEIRRVHVSEAGHGRRLEVEGAHGLSTLVVSTASWPALTARLRRLGAVEPVARREADLSRRYAGWLALARGLPWGVLAAGLLAGPLGDAPFVVWTWTGLAAAGAGAVGAAVEARVQGWRDGGIFWMTVAWGVALVAAALALPAS